jgi:hypothetical protein
MENLVTPYKYDPNRNKEKKDRNKKIVVKVLNGETLDNVGIEYDISRERVKQIVLKYCQCTNYVKNRLDKSSILWMQLSTLRAHKRQIVREIEEL